MSIPVAIRCPKCGSMNVHVSLTQTAASTRTRGRGCLWTLLRWTLIVCTLGLWLLVGKSRGKSKTHFHNQKMAVCQSCGNSWTV